MTEAGLKAGTKRPKNLPASPMILRAASYHHLQSKPAPQSCSQARLSTPNLWSALREMRADRGSVFLAPWPDDHFALMFHSRGGISPMRVRAAASLSLKMDKCWSPHPEG